MRVVLSPIDFWFHDLASCLHDCLGTVLAHYGHDPILTLGANWEFYHSPAQVSREEFFHPLPRPSLAASMMPFHPVASTWHRADDAHAAYQDLKDTVAAGRPALVAEDNYYIPFRPAYGDVHAAHLLVMYGFDEERDEVYVLDSTPPTFKGAIPVRDFLAARSSGNPVAGERDFFFAGAAIDNRWLELTVGADFPQLSRPWVSEVVDTNLQRFGQADGGDAFAGSAGLARYLRSIVERSRGPEGGRALDELYTVSWVAQAAAGLHADFLMAAGRRLGWCELAEAGRHVDALANVWTGLRMLCSHGFSEQLDVAGRVALRGEQLLLLQSEVLDRLGHTVAAAGR